MGATLASPESRDKTKIISLAMVMMSLLLFVGSLAF